MIAGLLKQTGVYLGADGDFLPAQQDNPLGFWEHFGFHALNERLLLHLGAGWDMSDLPNGWASRNDLAPFRDVARQLIERMRTSAEGRTAWGWKDPRNSITIPFWKAVLPELLVVVCVRNPLDVAGSLRRRNDMSFAASGRLWLRHYQSLLCNVAAQDRVVTRYESYFDDPHGELKRILGELRLPADDAAIAAAIGAVDPALRHHHASLEQLLASDCDPEIVEMYVHLCGEERGTGQMRPERSASAGTGFSIPDASAPRDHQRSRFRAETAQREEHNRCLIQENAKLRQLLEETRAQLSTLAGEMKTLTERADASDASLRRLTDKIAGPPSLERRWNDNAGLAPAEP